MKVQRNRNENVPGNTDAPEPRVYVVETKLSIYDEKAKRNKTPKRLSQRHGNPSKMCRKGCVRGKGNRAHRHKGTKGIRHHSKRSIGHGHHPTNHKGKGHKVVKSVDNKRTHSKGGAHRHRNKGHVSKKRSKGHGQHNSNRKGKGHKVKNKKPNSKGGARRHRNKGGIAALSRTRTSNRTNVTNQNETLNNKSNVNTSVISRSGDKHSSYQGDVRSKKSRDANFTSVQSITEVQKAPGLFSTKYSPTEHAFKYIMKKKSRTNFSHVSKAPSPSALAKTPIKPPTKSTKIIEEYLQNKKNTFKKSRKPLKN